MGDVPRIFTGRHLPSTPKQDKSVDGDDDNGEKRVTIWNWREKRKLSGNSAPFKKNLLEYLRKHPDWEEARAECQFNTINSPSYTNQGTNARTCQAPFTRT